MIEYFPFSDVIRSTFYVWLKDYRSKGSATCYGQLFRFPHAVWCVGASLHFTHWAITVLDLYCILHL